MNEHVRIPTATYRLQFNKNFTFQQAREIVAYLHHLGISDAYASPYFQAGAESLHGYDITDHNKLNAAIGSQDSLDAIDGADAMRFLRWVVEAVEQPFLLSLVG